MQRLGTVKVIASFLIIAVCATLSGCTLIGAATGSGNASVYNSRRDAEQPNKPASQISVGKSALLGAAVGAALDVAVVVLSLRNISFGFQCVDSTSPNC